MIALFLSKNKPSARLHVPTKAKASPTKYLEYVPVICGYEFIRTGRIRPV